MNGDDLGLTAGVNRAIIELHRAGVLTSATVMARAKATEDAIENACKHPALGVGCHVVLVDGKPILTPRDIRSLIHQPSARFHANLGAFLQRMITGRIRAGEIEAETAAQIRLLQARGLKLTHVDTHKHTHMFPAVLRPVLRAARAAGIRAVRNPFEPAWSVRACRSAPFLRRIEVSLLRRLEPNFRRIVAEEGFTTTDGAIGIAATGTLDSATIRSLLAQLPPGTWELVTHPGYNDPDLAEAGTRLLTSREIERYALLQLRRLTTANLVSFANLNPTEPRSH